MHRPNIAYSMNDSYLSAEELEALDQEMNDPNVGLINEVTTKKVAALASTGASKNAISKQLKISLYHVNRIQKTDEYRTYLTEIGDSVIASAKAEMRTAIAALKGKTIKALDKNLDKHSMDAVKTVLRAMGLDGQVKEDEGKGGGLTLILAGQDNKSPTVVEVSDAKSERKKDMQ